MSSCLSICRRYARLLPRVVTVVLAASLSAGAWAVNPKLVIGQRHMLLLTTEGAVWSWGESNTGYPVLGRGREAGSAPARIGVLGAGVRDVAAAGFVSLALKADGTVWAWGDSTQGQSGRVTGSSDADPSFLAEPVQVPGLSGITQVALAEDGRAAFALDAAGKLWSWGSNGSSRGILGQGDGSFSTATPTLVGGVTGLTQLIPNMYQGLASRNDGSVWGWGTDLPRNLMLAQALAASPPTTSVVLRPQALAPAGISGALASTTISNYEGGMVMFGIRQGQVFAWGESAEEGDGLASCHQRATAPMAQERAIGGLQGIQQMAAAGTAALFADDAGNLFACGVNDYGQLGDGTSVATSSAKPGPVRVQGLPAGASVHGVAMGERNAGVILRDGSVYVWGLRDEGLLGDGGGSNGLALTPARLGISAGAVPVNVSTGSPQEPTLSLPGYLGVQTGDLSAARVLATLKPATSHLGQRATTFMAALVPGAGLFLFDGASQQWRAFSPSQALPSTGSGPLTADMVQLNMPQPQNLTFAVGVTLFLGYGLGASAGDAANEMLQSRRYAPVLVLR
ncbi:MAG TPA: hypothetical protein PKD73_05940 [Burkholderiaceae bacterium]|nr:hypothetical protein [Burkholderiaceae bacterium]